MARSSRPRADNDFASSGARPCTEAARETGPTMNAHHSGLSGPVSAVRSQRSRGLQLGQARASNPETFATAKLTPLRLRSGGTPGIGRG